MIRRRWLTVGDRPCLDRGAPGDQGGPVRRARGRRAGATPCGLARALALAALVSTALVPAPVRAELSPLVINWDQFFQLDWRLSERQGQPVLVGHVRSIWKDGARWMQLLVDRMDDRGALLDQRLVWLPAAVPRGGQVPFEVRVEPAARYRVAVYAYEPPPRP
jgi:hypothetical protein